ncbi:MAG: universal stress protein UspA related nucleotide-binding protein [Halonotius sp. J07HN4]|nr:MAG: universal stress protein UspA related nucleotide-binding protein [Halonotius sp. J07HN4]
MRAIYATDLSAASEAAIHNETCLECLSRIGVEEIHLITVIPSNMHAGMPGMNFEERRREGLDRYERVMQGAGFSTDTHVVRGTPYRRINGLADAERADLTIVGSRGQSPLANRVLGSTARNLSRTTVVPLLVNRIEREADDPDVLREHLFQRVLYATDFSENAERAFNAFSSLRHATQEATLVHVESPKEPDNTDAADQLATLEGRLDQWDIDTDTPGSLRRSCRRDPRRRSRDDADNDSAWLPWAESPPAAADRERLRDDHRPGGEQRLHGAAAANGLR